METLFIFDFDDTLVDSEAEVRVTHQDGTTSAMSSELYAQYREEPGDVFDFTDFDAYPKNAEIIEPVFSELRSAISQSGSSNVVILTARSNPSPVQLFLKENDITGIEIAAVGSSDPRSKALYIIDRLKNGSYNQVVVFEDNVKNIRTIRKTLSDEGVKLTTNRVVNGKIADTRTESKKIEMSIFTKILGQNL